MPTLTVQPPAPPLTYSDLTKFRDELLREIKALVGAQVSSPPDSILRLPDVQQRSGYKRSSLYQKIAGGDFPAPVDLGGGHGIGWLESEVNAWVNSRSRVVPATKRGPRKRRTRANAETSSR